MLEDAGYTDAAVRDALETEVSATRDSLELPLYVRMLPEGERLSTLIKLFLLGLPRPRAEAAAAFAPAVARPARGDGRARRRERVSFSAQLELVPLERLLIACDPFLDELSRSDHVLGISPPTKAIAALTVRPEVDTALDLCTGNGIQALLAARHFTTCSCGGRQRTSTADSQSSTRSSTTSPRSSSGRANMFDPVEGISFDLIVCNPPYVISPDSEFIYRDSGTSAAMRSARASYAGFPDLPT